MPIIYINGDATKPKSKDNKLIIHICNNIGYWGKGFVLALSKRWKEPEQKYRKIKKLELNNVQFIKVEDDIWVANMIAQNGVNLFGKQFKKRIKYDALEECLSLVYIYAITHKCSIHMPKIGSGLAGGDWNIIERIIKQKLSNIDVYIYEFN